MDDDLKIFTLYLEATARDEPEMQVGIDGSKFWRLHGKLHRDDGPAYMHGQLHREDGPAVEFKNGVKLWYLRGKRYSTPEQWARSVLTMHNKPHDAAAIDAFLKSILQKDVEEAL